MTTLRCLRAIVWLRWRLIKNSVSGTRKRDALEQLSRALTMVMPMLVLAMSVGTFVAIAITGFIGGRMIAENLVDPARGLLVVRVIVGLMAITILALATVSPTQSSMSRYTRLLLLPIPRRVLHFIEVVASLLDPWVTVVAAGLLAFAAGLFSGGRPGVSLAALAAGVLTVGVIVCLGSVLGLLVTWFMRNRRRGELFTLLFVLAISLASFLPAFLAKPDESGEPRRRGQRREVDVERLDRSLPGWTHYLPSEIHARVVLSAIRQDRSTVTRGVAVLFLEVVVLYFASSRVHRQMLGSLEGDRGRRSSVELRMVHRKLPGMTVGASAVAWALTRGALRTVRGRLILLLPGPLLALMTAAFKGLPGVSFATGAAEYGYLLFGASIIFSLYAMQPFSMNCFGSDRAGLTLQLLAPVSDRELAWGKVVGFGGIAATAAAICLVAAVIVTHSGHLAYWIAVALGGAATFFLLSPLGIWMSALFPVASDLSKTGSGGNPHPLPLLAGALCTVLFTVPAIVILGITEFWLKSPFWAVPLMAGWMAVAAAIGLSLVNVAALSITARRENLAMVAQGK